jgi:hypothetical protein
LIEKRQTGDKTTRRRWGRRMRKTFRQQFPQIHNLAARSHSKKNGTPHIYVQGNIKSQFKRNEHTGTPPAQRMSTSH